MDGDVGGLDGLLDEGDRPGDVECEGLAGVAVDDGSADVRTGLLGKVDVLVGIHSGDDLALELDGSVDPHDGLSCESDLDVGLGALLPQLLDPVQGSDAVRVSGGAGGVEVESVGSGRLEPGGDVLDVPGDVGRGELGLLHGLLDLELPHEVGRVAVGSVGGVVETLVGHRSVEERGDDLRLDLLHGLHLHGDDGLHGLDGVVGVGELEGIGSEGPLVQEGRLQPSHVHSVPGVAVVAGEVELTDIVGEDDLVPGSDSDDPVLTHDDLGDVLHLAVVQLGDLSHVGRVGGSLEDVVEDLLLGEEDPLSVPHPGVVFCH